MIIVKKGDKVAVDYEGRFENGEVFDSSTHGEHSHPLVFVVGSGQVIPGFDNAVIGLHQGQTREVTIKPEEAYGMPNEQMKQEVPLNAFALPNNQKPQVGMQLVMGTPDGRRMMVKVAAVGKESVTLDFNHPLAGKTLMFKLTIVGINETIKEEKQH